MPNTIKLPRYKGRGTFAPVGRWLDDCSFVIRPARYASGKVAVAVSSNGENKSRAARILSALPFNYSRRERAYIGSPAAAEKFYAAVMSGADASLADVKGVLGWTL